MNQIPKWNLALVLEALRNPPFEPLNKTDMSCLTAKTVFLTALASGKRRSELHALVFEKSGLVSLGQAFLLQMDENFLSKTDRVYRRLPKSFTIPKLPQDEPEERLLCPVRALQIYVQRTKDLRKRSKAKKFFISYKEGFTGEIATQTISRWIALAVKKAYEVVSQNTGIQTLYHVKAHDVRALSASLAWTNQTALEDVLAAAGWKTHTTFTSFYLRDLTLQTEDLMSLGPLVASQKVVQWQ